MPGPDKRQRSYQNLTVKRTKGSLPRKVAVYLAVEFSGKNFYLIAKFFKKTSATGVLQTILRINKSKISSLYINNDITNLNRLIQQ